MDAAKIRLSPKEMELILNADWILTKNRIVEKTKALLGILQDQMTAHMQANLEKLPAGITVIPPKISKGENYKGLPYLILDYPRIFEKDNTFAVRTLFWWGNFFSITLQLRGNFKEQWAEKIIRSFDSLSRHHFYCCINNDEWEHHFEPTNYQPVAGMTSAEFRKTIEAAPFIKIAKKITLRHWDDAIESLSTDFKMITGMLMA